MTNALSSASFVTQLAGAEHSSPMQGYFRSKLFVASSTTNPLVAAANPLLSLLERLSMSPSLPAIHLIRDKIEHEVFAFHSRLLSAQYAHEFIAISRYLISATIDELLGKNYLRLYGQPAEFKAFTPSSVGDKNPAQQFFNLINYLKERAHQYLDLLELAYYCLIAGFEGEYHQRADGRQRLDLWIDELHQLIQQHRVNKSYRLFKEKNQLTPKTTDRQAALKILAITFSLVTVFYLVSHVILDRQAQNILNNNTLLFSTMDYEWTTP